jgi:hypothetical protein
MPVVTIGGMAGAPTRTVKHFDERTGRSAGWHVDHADGRRDAVVTPPCKTVTVHASDFGLNVRQLADLMVELERKFPAKPQHTASGLVVPGGSR